ncbi:hypothetical protein ACGFI0_08015 [Micromonospora carbonacea]
MLLRTVPSEPSAPPIDGGRVAYVSVRSDQSVPTRCAVPPAGLGALVVF